MPTLDWLDRGQARGDAQVGTVRAAAIDGKDEGGRQKLEGLEQYVGWFYFRLSTSDFRLVLCP